MITLPASPASLPIWLADEPEIRALLGVVLDRFDQQSGDSRARPITVPVARYVPSLASNNSAADRTWGFINDLQRAGVLSIRASRRGPYDPAWHGAKLGFAPPSEMLLRGWLGRPAEESAMLQWRRAVEQYSASFPGGTATLLTRRIPVAGCSPEDVVGALARLGKIQVPATLRQLSTFAFRGDSKILDDRADLIAALFPRLQIRERPLVVAVHLPERIEGLLFIENQDTYTSAVAGQPAATLNHALVYMAGFRGAAVRIRESDGACLHFGGPGRASRSMDFERYWFGADPWTGTLGFWGDLDFAGMQILKSLRGRFGDVVAWQPGYLPMLDDLCRCGQPRSSDEPRGQVDPGFTGCHFADTQLLPAMRDHGFWHQERIADVPDPSV
ncbi:MAG TPA: hypothetical protein VGN07_04025 [Steroidobacteraceae bacterium]